MEKRYGLAPFSRAAETLDEEEEEEVEHCRIARIQKIPRAITSVVVLVDQNGRRR